MSADATDADPDFEGHPAADGPLPAFVDWLLGAAIALGGGGLLVGGAVLWVVVDRDLLAEHVEGGTVTVTPVSEQLTDAEMLEFLAALVSWTSVGLLVTGLGMVAFAVGFVVRRHRVHRRARRDEAVSSYGAFAVLGAVLTAVLSFLPFSPVIGGGAAGYLERAHSERTVSVGVIAGLLSVLPVLSVLAFVLGGAVAGMLAIGRSGTAILLAAIGGFALMVIATVGASLGAIGGYVGGRFAEDRVFLD